MGREVSRFAAAISARRSDGPRMPIVPRPPASEHGRRKLRPGQPAAHAGLHDRPLDAESLEECAHGRSIPLNRCSPPLQDAGDGRGPDMHASAPAVLLS